MRRRNGKLTMTGWLGIAALGAMQYMGPRPLFVKTAYAAAEAPSLTATLDIEATELSVATDFVIEHND